MTISNLRYFGAHLKAIAMRKADGIAIGEYKSGDWWGIYAEDFKIKVVAHTRTEQGCIASLQRKVSEYLETQHDFDTRFK